MNIGLLVSLEQAEAFDMLTRSAEALAQLDAFDPGEEVGARLLAERDVEVDVMKELLQKK